MDSLADNFDEPEQPRIATLYLSDSGDIAFAQRSAASYLDRIAPIAILDEATMIHDFDERFRRYEDYEDYE